MMQEQEEVSFKTTIQLQRRFFDAMRNQLKRIEIRKKDYGLSKGDIVRFTNGYNPENGSILRQVDKVLEKHYRDITVRELIHAEIDNISWLLDYAGNQDKLYLIYLMGGDL
jgi:hypothetical protein